MNPRDYEWSPLVFPFEGQDCPTRLPDRNKNIMISTFRTNLFWSGVGVKVAQYSFKKMENSRFRCVFLDNYSLLINKKYLSYIKQYLKSLNFCTKVTQRPLLWQQ